MLWFYVLIFIISCILFYLSAELIIEGLIKIARLLKWREFVVAFLVMASASSLPNLFVGLTSALRGIPQLSFGDVSGNNLVALTLAVAIAVFFTKGGIPTESRMVQKTSIFTMISVILPLFLILDGDLSRIDGVLLIGFFAFYIYWLFSKEERFTKVYDGFQKPPKKEFKFFLKDFSKLIFGLIMIIIAAQGVVMSAQFFANNFNLSLVLIGVLITGLGSSLPELYFDVISARKGETWMILGDLMGAIIMPSTLVLGLVALICPIQFFDFSSLAIARVFIIISALSFLLFVRSGRKITKKEALFLLFIYIAFLISEIFFQQLFRS